MSDFRQFVANLRERSVFKVATVYAIVAWLLVQVASIVQPALRLPEWLTTLAVVLAFGGFPIALLLSWFLEWHPHGLTVERAEPGRMRWIAAAAFGVVASAALGIAAWQFVTGLNATRSLTSETDDLGVMVLPLAHPDGDSAARNLAIGIQEQLITNLGRVYGLRPVPRASIERVSDRHSSVPDLAAALDAVYAIEGSVSRKDDGFAVILRIVEADNDNVLTPIEIWRPLTEIDDLQTLASTDAAFMTAWSLENRRRFAADPGQSINPEALAALQQYLAGYTEGTGRSPQEQVIDHLEGATRADPAFWQAHAHAAIEHTRAFAVHGLPKEEHCPQAAQHVAETERLRGDHWLTLRARMMHLQMCVGDNSGALERARRVAELNPASGRSHVDVMQVALSAGRFDEAATAASRALEINPFSHLHRNIGHMLIAMRRYAEAREVLEAGLRLRPGSDFAGLIPISRYLETGDRKYMREFLSDPDASRQSADRGYMYSCLGEFAEGVALARESGDEAMAAEYLALAGQTEEARPGFESARKTLLDAMTAGGATSPIDPQGINAKVNLAYLEARLGESDQARARLEGVAVDDILRSNAFHATGWIERMADSYIVLGEKERGMEMLTLLLKQPSLFSVPALLDCGSYASINQHPVYRRRIEAMSQTRF
jgi:TolB-like protein